MMELLLPCGFDTLKYTWVKATIGICILANYSVANKCQHLPHPSAILDAKTSPGSPWVARTLPLLIIREVR
jgi:hypothetical protein